MRIQQVTHHHDSGPLSFDSYRFVPILSHFDYDIAGGTLYHDPNLFGSDSYQFVLIFSSFSFDLAGATLSNPFFFLFLKIFQLHL